MENANLLMKIDNTKLANADFTNKLVSSLKTVCCINSCCC